MEERQDLISRQAAIDYCYALINAENPSDSGDYWNYSQERINQIEAILHHLEFMPSAQSEIIRCRECKHWKQQTNYAGAPLSFGFCESDDMWRSLYGETCEVSHIDTDDDFYCGFAERRTDG